MPLSLPHMFSGGGTPDGAQLDAHFDEIRGFGNHLESEIDRLEGLINGLEGRIHALEQMLGNLEVDDQTGDFVINRVGLKIEDGALHIDGVELHVDANGNLHIDNGSLFNGAAASPMRWQR